MCEESSSIELRSLDIALCVDEVTQVNDVLLLCGVYILLAFFLLQVMKKFRENSDNDGIMDILSPSTPKDFSLDDLCILKAMFLELEKAIDAIPITSPEGNTLPGEFMLDILAKADLSPGKKDVIADLLDRVIQFLTVASTSPYQRKGTGLQKFSDLVKIVFSKSHFTADHMERVKRSYKVHIKVEQPKSRGKGDSWSTPKVVGKAGRVLSYWCFSPGFGKNYNIFILFFIFGYNSLLRCFTGMRDLVEEGARCLILTSGTLSPLNSFAAELQVPFPVTLENPHIISSSQV
jgi:regulator of telomere elongation helicase 1